MWRNWKKEHPKPGFFVYVRDLKEPEIWDIGWAMGSDGDTTVCLVNDPMMGRHYRFDEWQYVPVPVE